MPNPITLAANQALVTLRTRDPRPGSPVISRSRWSEERAAAWAESTGWLVGCNFTPSTASNQLEMWQRETFDLTTIDRELGWAADLGMNSARIFLHDLAWQRDGDGFLDRVDQVLGVAASHGISVMPVLFDGIWSPFPRIGPQPEPRPGVHNSTWVQSPGAEILRDPARWPALRPYVDSVIGRFGSDPRVVAWDLFNEPDSPNLAYFRREIGHKSPLVARLLDQVFDWAAAIDPDQPLTAGVYLRTNRHPERATQVSRVSLERSDIVTFHSYQSRVGLESTIRHLRSFGRPLVCTEWLARPRSPVALLDVFAANDVGAYCWGLVDGRSQTKYSWASWIRRDSATSPWFHELLHPDGVPFDTTEATTFRRVTARMRGSN